MTLKTIPIQVTLQDPTGAALVGVAVKAVLVKSSNLLEAFDVDSGIVAPQSVSVSTNSAGLATLPLWPNARGSQSTLYRVSAKGSDGSTLLQAFVAVPDSDPLIPIALGDLLGTLAPAASISYLVPPRSGVDLAGLNDATSGLDWSSPGTLDLWAANQLLLRATAAGLQLPTGTANGVTYLNASKQLTSGSALVFDGVNLGIGTSLPVSKFVVSNSGANGFEVEPNFSTGTETRINGYDRSSAAFKAIGTNAAEHYWLTSGTERMRLDASGNLGIGTTSPSAKLQLAAAGDTVLKISPSSAGTARLRLEGTGGGAAAINSSANGLFIATEDAAPMVFSTNNTERLRIDASGNLGLGVTPSAWGSPFNALQVSRLGLRGSTATAGLSLNTYYDGAAFRYIATGILATDYYQNSGQHVWNTAPSGTAGNPISFTQAMTLDANGNLGIGTSSPSSYQKVTVWGGNIHVQNTVAGAGVGARLVLADSNNACFVQTVKVGSSSQLSLGADNQEWLRIDGSGNLLVGTTSVLQKLTVNGNIGLSRGQLINFSDTTALNNLISGDTSNNLLFWTNGAEKMRLDASGNLGIGTSSPSARLHVYEPTSAATRVRVLANGGQQAALQLAGNGTAFGTTSFDVFQDGGSDAYVANRANASLQFWTNSVERLRIDPSGNTTPGTDNTQTLGSAAKRWSVVYAGTGTINTSDAREKTPVSALTTAELAAAQALAAEIGTYQFLSAVADKGSAARCHVGMTVQRAIEIMQAHQLNPMRYGFVCHDVWDATYEDQVSDTGSLSRQVQRQVTVAQEQHSTRIEIIDGQPVQVRETTVVQVPQTDLLPVLDEAGQPVLTEVPEVLAEDGTVQTPASHTPLLHPVPRMETITERYDRIETRPAGDRYSFRPDELLLFISAGLAARLASVGA